MEMKHRILAHRMPETNLQATNGSGNSAGGSVNNSAGGSVNYSSNSGGGGGSFNYQPINFITEIEKGIFTSVLILLTEEIDTTQKEAEKANIFSGLRTEMIGAVKALKQVYQKIQELDGGS